MALATRSAAARPSVTASRWVVRPPPGRFPDAFFKAREAVGWETGRAG
jgi:hypothetical protein